MEKKRGFKYKSYGKGFPVVIIPGLDGVTEFFNDIIPELSPKYRTIKYYIPLVWEAKAEHKEYSFDYIADDLKNVLTGLGIKKAHIIGESFGGVITQFFALKYPKMIEKLVLISTFAQFTPPEAVKTFRTQAAFAKDHVHLVCEPQDPEWAKMEFIKGATFADHASVEARLKITTGINLSSRLKELNMPTLCVIGGADHFTGEASKKTFKLLPNAKKFVVPNGGHLCHMVSPDLFLKAALEFLA